MSNQNRPVLLPPPSAGKSSSSNVNTNEISNICSVDADFDSYWEEEARNPHRNRIRIGRQYQATVPALLKPGDTYKRKLEDLETLRFCPKKSAHLSKAELDHYFNVANSMNLFASLVETRCLLGEDVTIADLNHIRHKEGLSLASVIQPPAVANLSLSTNGQTGSNASQDIPSPSSIPTNTNANVPTMITASGTVAASSSSSSSSPTSSSPSTVNPLIKALSHFISLHHPIDRETGCKKKTINDTPNDDGRQSDSASVSPLTEVKMSRSRLARNASSQKNEAAKQQQQQQQQLACDDSNAQALNAWTRGEIELFTKALEICGKNFGLIKKEFFPSKSLRSIVEHYYIGTKEMALDTKRKTASNITDTCGGGQFESQSNNRNGGGGHGTGGHGTGGQSSTGGGGSGSTMSTGSAHNRLSTNNSDQQQSKKSSNNTPTKSCNKQSATTPTKNASNATSTPTTKPTAANEEDPRLSVYSFDNNDESQTSRSLLGPEVKPLKAKPIVPNTNADSDLSTYIPTLGSLKFYMDGQLVLKLNAQQDQVAGNGDKCQWVQSQGGKKIEPPGGRQNSLLDSSADLMMLNAGYNAAAAAAQMQSPPASDYMISNRLMPSSFLATTSGNVPRVRTSPSAGLNDLQRPPRAHSTSSSASSSSTSTLPFANNNNIGSLSNSMAIASNNYTSPVTPSPSPANIDTNSASGFPIDLTLDTSAATGAPIINESKANNQSVDLSMGNAKRSTAASRKQAKARTSKPMATATNGAA